LQSSTVIESAIAGKRIILPLFHDFLNTTHLNNFYWKDNLELFDVATNKNEFKKLFKDIIDNPDITENVKNKRIRLFEKWFDSTKGDSLDKYYKIISSVVH